MIKYDLQPDKMTSCKEQPPKGKRGREVEKDIPILLSVAFCDVGCNTIQNDRPQSWKISSVQNSVLQLEQEKAPSMQTNSFS